MQKVVKSIKIRDTEHDTGYKLPAFTTNHDTTKVQTAGHTYGRPTTSKGIFHGLTTKRGARLRARPKYAMSATQTYCSATSLVFNVCVCSAPSLKWYCDEIFISVFFPSLYRIHINRLSRKILARYLNS